MRITYLGQANSGNGEQNFRHFQFFFFLNDRQQLSKETNNQFSSTIGIYNKKIATETVMGIDKHCD